MDIADSAVKQRALEELKPVSKQQESDFKCADAQASGKPYANDSPRLKIERS